MLMYSVWEGGVPAGSRDFQDVEKIILSLPLWTRQSMLEGKGGINGLLKVGWD